MKIKYTRISSPSYSESVKLRIMIVIAAVCLYLFIKTIFIPDHGGYRLLYIPLCITLGYMCLKYLHEWYHYFNITAPPLFTETGNYSVDIFTTYCEGEPLDMLERTLEAMSLIRYPHTSWCCDEADDPLVKDLCSKYGIRHITREGRKDAKAGNINNALRYATSDICVILDPDHIPAPEFLDVVLPYFKDEKVGFVQVVQAYYNHHESLVAKGAAQQTYQFYGPMMMCMYAYGTVQALGANCTFRRAALDSIGGHATGLAEDMHTAMKLHAKGWTSVYVPAVIARGLVPSTLSSYYKQQLKWSRGTFELLVSTYPRLFKNFTGFQKLHYFLLPFHYLSGFIFLLNFLIPVLSLFLAEPPLRLDFTDFVLAAIPLAFMIALIRQYVQKWVVEENERGFHIVGGLLQIGTWWVHLTGLVYTLVRKKIPYIPTPKNDVETTPFTLHIPNLIIILLSVVAIVYGLNYDWTPFSIFMSGLAFTNICILLFVIYASYKTNRQFSQTRALMKTKRRLWYFRHWTYKVARNYALVFSTLVVAGTIYVHDIYNSEQSYPVEETPMQTAFYKGVFQPASENGISQVADILSETPADIQIVSHYIAWTDSSNTVALPSNIDKLYERHITPLITLEPWLNRKPIFNEIISGAYDAAIDSIAKQFAQLKGPVFFRFAHEPENPRYPWSFAKGNTPESFIAAWRYLHKKFEETGAKKMIWVWNPWKADSIEKFFPGQSYVDWLGVNILDYSENNQSISFEDLYQPFHNDSIFELGMPVMLTEVGSLSLNKKEWWNNAWSVMQKKFPEIRAAIMFNSGFDHYNSDGYQLTSLPWKWDFDSAFQLAPVSAPFHQRVFENLSLQPVASSSGALPLNMRAVGYDKGVHWFRNLHTASIKVLESDVRQMKALGINTILRTLPDIYSRNFYKVAEAEELNVIPRLWADLPISKLMDDNYLKKEQERLVELVKKI